MKTNELTGAALDWAVAKCEGRGYVMDETEYAPDGRTYQRGIAQSGGPNYSSDWMQGGPIIEREGIAIGKSWEGWKAFTETSGGEGPTPLIAAMRCYVASKLGDEVEIPEELQ
jgi:hypothetical protein